MSILPENVLNYILRTLRKEPTIDAYTLWRRLDDFGYISVRQLDDALIYLCNSEALPSNFRLRGLKHCPVCTDGTGRHHAFVRRQDKIAHMIDHAKYGGKTLPKFTARWKARQERRQAILGGLFA